MVTLGYYLVSIFVIVLLLRVILFFMDIRSHRSFNDDNAFILTCIDVFSKRAWALPLKNKTGERVCEALSKVLAGQNYTHIQTDKGKEFYNEKVSYLLSRNNIKQRKNSFIKPFFNWTQKYYFRPLNNEGVEGSDAAAHNFAHSLNLQYDFTYIDFIFIYGTFDVAFFKYRLAIRSRISEFLLDRKRFFNWYQLIQ